jgi:OOP family OmpA-OmpF porin
MTHYSKKLFGMTLAAATLFAGPASAQSVEELAKQLAMPAAEAAPACEASLPDGTCADLPDTRQMRLPGAGKVVATASRAIRADINMSFLLGSAELTAQARATLDRFAASLLQVGSYRPFVVEGHTDRSGTRETNMALSAARAQAVVNYLAAKGVDRSRLVAQGYGYDRPLAGRSPEDAANRRVEVAAR